MAEPGVEQKLAAILAADVAGYTRLMADDEPATIVTIAEYRSIFRTYIEANGGRVVDMAGDSILAVFTSAAGAVKAAVDAQSEVATRNVELPEARQMRFRVGVNLGDIREANDGTVYGEGVNIAARLEGLAEPGHICLSDKVHTEVRGKLDIAFDDMGEHKVKNVAEPVRAYRVLEAGTQFAAAHRHPRWLIPAAAAAVVIVAGVAVWQGTKAPPPPMVTAAGAPIDDPVLAAPTGPAIAVLPFDNMSGDPEQEYFTDGITEDIIGALSRFRELFVIARNSTFVYKGQAVDVRQVGRDLGVHYVLEGSVRRSGERVKIAVQLIDAAKGSHLWSETYDRELSDIFAVQEEISARIAGALAARIDLDAYARARQIPTDDLTAYEQVLRARRYFLNKTEAAHTEARALLEDAVRRDPDYALAHAYLALIYGDEFNMGFNTQPDAIDRMERVAKRAVALDPMDAWAHSSLAEYYFHTHQRELFEVEAQRVLALNPNFAEGLVWLSFRRGQLFGRERMMATEVDIRRGMRLDPNHPSKFHRVLARVLFFAGRYEDAQAEINKADHGDDNMWKHYWTAVIQAQLGNLDAARAAAGRFLELRPGSTLVSLVKDYNIHESYWDTYFEAFPKAGIPLGDTDRLEARDR